MLSVVRPRHLLTGWDLEHEVTAKELRAPWGFSASVKLRAYREPVDERKHIFKHPKHVFESGFFDVGPARKSLKPVVADGCVRGFWGQSGSLIAISVPLESLFHAGGPPAENGNIVTELKVGQPFWETSEPRFLPALREWKLCPTVVTVDRCNWAEQSVNVLTETTVPLKGKEYDFVEMPVAKFMELYNPNWYLRTKQSRMLRLKGDSTLLSHAVAGKFPWALGLLTLGKICVRWKQLANLARHNVNKPGGPVFKRAMADFEGHLEAEAAAAEAKMCDELQADAESLFKDSDWNRVALRLVRGSHGVRPDGRSDTDVVVEAMASASAAPLEKRLDTPYYVALSERVEHRRKRLRAEME